MKTIYIISEYNLRTKTYEDLDTITACSTAEARAKFVEDTKWKKRRGFTLVVRMPICK